VLHWNLSLMNLKGPEILLFIAGVLLLQGFFLSVKLITEGLRIKFSIADFFHFIEEDFIQRFQYIINNKSLINSN
jgi:hypothetical protein